MGVITPPAKTYLAIGLMTPQMKFAPNMAPWPFISLFRIMRKITHSQPKVGFA